MISGNSTEPGRPSEPVRQAGGAEPELASTEVAMGRPSTDDVVIEGAMANEATNKVVIEGIPTNK